MRDSVIREATAVAAGSGAVTRVPAYSPLYASYALFALTVALAFNFADRQLMTILLEPIKHEFGVGDTAMGLLTGLTFVLFYATLAVPIARLADRVSRRSVIVASIGAWSVMTAACGVAPGFWQLAAARVGVGVGEAGCLPASQAMLADYFPPRWRSTALGVYSTGAHFGVLLGMFGGALLAQLYGWRAAFVLLGLPGLAVAAWVRLTVAEPPRGQWERRDAGAAPPLAELMRTVLRSPSYRLTALGAGFTTLAGFGLATWMPSFLVRVHGMPLVDAGLVLGLSGALAGLAGAAAGGVLCDRLTRRDPRWQLRLPALAVLLALPVECAFLLWPEGQRLAVGTLQLPTAVLFVPVGAFLLAVWMGPTHAAVQNLVPPAWRAQSSALMMLINSLLGMGCGPLLVGVLSDVLTPALGVEALRYALLITVGSLLLGAACYWCAGAHYRRERGAA